MTILLIALAAVLLLGGGGLIYYSTIFRPAQLHMQATATVQTFLTVQTQNTATAQAHATGTAQAYANATATAQAQATAQAVATATALQNIYNTATGGTPVLNDPLSRNDIYNWDEFNNADGSGCVFTGGALHSKIPQKNFYLPCFAENSNFSNFAFQVEVKLIKGDYGGVLFRADNPNSRFYLFYIGRDGYYSLSTSQKDTRTKTVLYGFSPLIKTDLNQTNLLTVIARGSTIYLYINKQFVDSVKDSTYKSGQIGVFAGAVTNPTEVAFKNAKVWNL